MGKYTLKRKGQMNDKDSHRQMIGAGVGSEKFDWRSILVGHGRIDGKLLMECFRFGLEADGLCSRPD